MFQLGAAAIAPTRLVSIVPSAGDGVSGGVKNN
ncbi:unnamed protein product [Lactuca saligna]|uniref:Uncharacterized protein n=1 Tax=Lactuca saligna TaxID=75948 RepID=A0AA35Y6D9_LACSI|nr:unnamed protein product [Lactuca saligna]